MKQAVMRAPAAAMRLVSRGVSPKRAGARTIEVFAPAAAAARRQPPPHSAPAAREADPASDAPPELLQ